MSTRDHYGGRIWGVDPALYPTERVANPNTLQGLAQFERTLDQQVGVVNKMSVTGAKNLSEQFRTMIDGVRKQLNEASSQMVGAHKELNEVADQAHALVKQVKTETAELKSVIGQISNGPVDA